MSIQGLYVYATCQTSCFCLEYVEIVVDEMTDEIFMKEKSLEPEGPT